MEEKKISIRRERFERYAVKRVQYILNNLSKLENCANKNNYEYSDNDVKKIFKTIKDRTDDVQKEFEKQLNKGNKPKFEL